MKKYNPKAILKLPIPQQEILQERMRLKRNEQAIRRFKRYCLVHGITRPFVGNELRETLGFTEKETHLMETMLVDAVAQSVLIIKPEDMEYTTDGMRAVKIGKGNARKVGQLAFRALCRFMSAKYSGELLSEFPEKGGKKRE